MGAVLPSTLCALWFCTAIGRQLGLQSRPARLETEPPFVYYEDGDGDPVVIYERRPAREKPDSRSNGYLLDITNRHFSYNRSVAGKVKNPLTWSRLVGQKNSGQKAAHRTTPQHALQTRINMGASSTTEARSKGPPVAEISRVSNGPKSSGGKPVLTTAAKRESPSSKAYAPGRTSPHQKRTWRTTRTTGSWQFGYTAHSVKRLDPRNIFRLGLLQRRDRRQGRTSKRGLENRWTQPAEEGHDHSSVQPLPSNRVKRTVLCLLVAGGVFLITLFFLVPAALWVRSQYRSCSGKSEPYYSTLSADDSDTKPIVSIASLPPHRRNSLNDNAKVVRPRATLGFSVSEPVMFSPQKTTISVDRPGGSSAAEPFRKDGSTAASSYPEQRITDVSPTLADSGDSKVSVSSDGRSLDVTGSDSAPKRRKVLRIQAEKKHPDLLSRDAVTKATLEPLNALPQEVARGADITAPQDGTPREGPEAPGRDRRRDSGQEDSRRGLKDWMPSESPKAGTSRASEDKPLSSVSEDYQQYSDSDDVPLQMDLGAGPLPTFIRRSVTKTTRRWRNRAPSFSPSTMASSSTITSQRDSDALDTHRQGAGRCSDDLHHRSPVTSTVSSDVKGNCSFECLAIRTAASKKPPVEADCCYLVTGTASGPWAEILPWCSPPKMVDFLHVIHEDCRAVKVRDGPDGDIFRVVSCQGDRFLSVRRLDDVRKMPGLLSSLKVAQELSRLKDSVDNRTSAFFIDARTTCVRDVYPRVLWDARIRHEDGRPPADQSVRQGDLQAVGCYLVTQMQPNWSPLSDYKLKHADQALSVLRQACCALAVAEVELELEHRLLVSDALLVRPTRSPRVEFTLRGVILRVPSAGLKLRVQGLRLARIKIGAQVESPDFLDFREYVSREADEQIHTTCTSIAGLLSKRPSKFLPLTNVLWLRYLADWLGRDLERLEGTPQLETLQRWRTALAESQSAAQLVVAAYAD